MSGKFRLGASLVSAVGFITLLEPSCGAASFVAAGNLVNSRNSHTATLLADGRVLVAGGYHSGSPFYLSSVEVYDPAFASWSATGNLLTARLNHTATLLQNGKVLVAGGTDASGNLASAELYDPASGNWTATGSLIQARYSHTATLLPDGKVLIIGGAYATLNGPVNLAAAEIYDPASGQWSAAGEMSVPRNSHTATMLPNGKVLIAGGLDGPTFLRSSELYDSSTGSWTNTGALSIGRGIHAATLLPNGKVLAMGGTGGDAAAEIYDPASGNWTNTGSMSSARWSPSASLLPNGKVLVAGGYRNPGSLTVYSTTELYDPNTGTWTLSASMSAPRYNHTATLLHNGRVLVAGGAGANTATQASIELYESAVGSWTATGPLSFSDSSRNSAVLLTNGRVLIASGQIYDPESGAWTNISPLIHARIDCKLTLLPSGKVLVTGGLDAGTRDSIALTELFDPGTGTFNSAGNLNISRYDHRATLLANGKVLVSGGFNGVYPSGSIVAAGEIYDPLTGVWTLTGSMSIGRDGHTATLLTNGLVLVTGGTRFQSGGFTEVVNCDLYNPATGVWTATGALSARRSSHTATLLPDGRVLVTGGHYYQSGTFFRNLTEIYNPATGIWTTVGSLNSVRASHTATLLPNGKVLVAGGRQTTSGATMNSAELYDPVAKTWTVTGSLLNARVWHTATLLLNGKVLAVGGSPDNGMNYHTQTELFDVRLEFAQALQPVISTVSSPVILGSSAALGGTGFRGVSEASCGNAQNSASDHVVLQLRNTENEQTRVLGALAWNSNSFTSTPVTGLPPGWAMVTAFVNGIPSTSGVTLLKGLATINFSNLVQTFNGAARVVTVTTSPAGLPVNVAYNGNSSAPTNPGLYPVIATVTHPAFAGTASNTLTILRQLAAGTVAFRRAHDLGLRIATSELLANVTSLPAGTTNFFLTSVGPAAPGVELSTNSAFILYTSPNNNNDSFPYRVTDGAGAFATGYVIVNVQAALGGNLPPASIKISGNTATVSSFGIPGYTYILESATNLIGPWWVVGTNVASTADGSLQFIDPNATNNVQYYRTAQP